MIILVRVYSRSGREEVVKISEDSYKVYLKKPAEDNKANVKNHGLKPYGVSGS